MMPLTLSPTLDLLRTTVLAPADSAPERLEMMCRAVQRVIVENFNYCNRTCPFCPNSKIDRRSHKVYFPDQWFESLLAELAAGSYRHAFLLGRYHEPLADPIVFDRLRLARSYLPHSRMFLNTNGDYVTLDMLMELEACGLDEVKVMQYLPAHHRFTTDAAIRQCQRWATRVGVELVLTEHQPDVVVRFRAATALPHLKVTLHSENYRVAGLGCDRGGALKGLSGQRRTAPCYAPYFELNINYDGSVSPCCNLLPDVPTHQAHMMGNVGEASLCDIFWNDAFRAFRVAVDRASPHPTVCHACHYYWPAVPTATPS